MPACPVCTRPTLATDARCGACGADLYDPDVRALTAAAAAAAGDGDAAPAGALTAGKVLGVSAEALADGTAIARLAAGGAVLAGIAWLLPVAQLRSAYIMAWDDRAGGAVARFLPAILAAAAGALAFARRRLPLAAAYGILAALGLAGFLFALLPFGDVSYTPTATLPLVQLGLLAASAALVVRLHDPASVWARRVLAGGAALVVAGYFVPLPELARRLPGELWGTPFDTPDWKALAPSLLGALRRYGLAGFLVSGFLLVPLLAVPVAAALAWARPKEAWDKAGLRLRPLAWLLVLFLPLLYGLTVFNLWGAGGHLAGAILVARARQALLSVPFSLWAVFGAAGLLAAARTAPASTR